MHWRHTLPRYTVMVMEEWRSCYWSQPEYTHQFASTASEQAFLGPFLISILLPGIASFFYSPIMGKDLITKQRDSFSGLLPLIPLVVFTKDYTFLPQNPFSRLLTQGIFLILLPLSENLLYSSFLKYKHSLRLCPWPPANSILFS